MKSSSYHRSNLAATETWARETSLAVQNSCKDVSSDSPVKTRVSEMSLPNPSSGAHPSRVPVTGAPVTSARPAGACRQASEWLDGPLLARVASRVAWQRGMVEGASDLLQEIRLAVLRIRPDVLLNATWVFQTARHKASDIAARRWSAPVRAGDREDPSGSEPGSGPDMLRLLRARASRLPDDLRTFYGLRYREGLSQRQIASRLGLSRSSIRWMEGRCVRMIRGRLEKASVDQRTV